MAAWLSPVELARATGVSTSTLRHYEKVGVLPLSTRAANGYRRYPKEAVTRVRVVRAALELGFSLRELSEVFGVKDRGGRPCQRVRALADEKIAAIDTRIRELKQLKRKLTALSADWDARLGRVPPGKQAHLLEALDERKNEHVDLRNPRLAARPRFPARAAPARSRHDASERLRRPRSS